MNQPAATFEVYEQLIPVAQKLYGVTSGLSWKLLLPLFLISIAMSYSADLGLTAAVILKLKRLIIVALLLVSFPMISEFSQSVGVELAKSIDDMTGIDFLLEAAGTRADKFSFDIQTLLTLSSDFLLGALVFLSFLLLNLARYFLVAFQHFYWFLLVITGPFLILPSLFESASGITKSMFKSMLQVAAWPIVWSVLSAFLKAIPFVVVYTDSLNLVTVVTLNLIVAIALLFSPFLVSHLTEGAGHTTGDTLRRGLFKAAAMTNPKTAAFSMSRSKAMGKTFVAAQKGARK